ncbi:hypothetical protein AOA57_10000 [Pseudomonas sp. 2588-5]|nr:hypothetical protein AOA57_10000 [Pseudomonas sp. 2588-5]
MVFNDDAGEPDKTRRPHVFRRQAGSYKGLRIHDAKRVALDLDFDLRRPVKHAGRTQALERG